MDVEFEFFFSFFAPKWAQDGTRWIISKKRKLVGNGKLSRTQHTNKWTW